MRKQHLRYILLAGSVLVCLMIADTQTVSSNSSTYNTNMYGAKTGLNHAMPSKSEDEVNAESTALRTSFLGQDNPPRSRYPGWLGLFGLLGLLGLRGRSREKS
ncbi:MYXO-CTERM domain-containing protein [Paenibacillus taihuensis]|uniref:MYXO-CTERM domain-containing protein n=1 Tax=Paenibacillus taihuensis TaxID=1156355 RepID=A0A3D9SFD0_9BACL|nr:hypothetical protein [Paenibacillus taihuensis]REE94337.1 MYXO-CTERM domain-containing protein [Paenibacillus taihuensis]